MFNFAYLPKQNLTVFVLPKQKFANA